MQKFSEWVAVLEMNTCLERTPIDTINATKVVIVFINVFVTEQFCFLKKKLA